MEWAQNRRTLVPDDVVPENLFESHDPSIVSKYLRMFVLEVQKADGTKYTPGSIRSLLSGLNRTLKENKAPFSIFDNQHPEFRELCKTLDVVSSSLHKEGIGADPKKAPVIVVDDEDRFWEMGLLGYSSPRVLQRTVFFYIGLRFALRGVQEQHDLLRRQFVRVPSDVAIYNSHVYYQYTEFISKNNQHRFKEATSASKVCRAYAIVGSDRCIVKLMDEYLPRLPPMSPFIYCRPLERIPDDTLTWYANQRVGVNTLKSIVPSLSKQSQCTMKYTNHSLRATATTRMFCGKVPEKLIAETTGHRSVKALRGYERTQPAMHQAVGNIIMDREGAKEFSMKQGSVVKEQDVAIEGQKCDVPPAEKKPCFDNLPSHAFSGTLKNCTINISYH